MRRRQQIEEVTVTGYVRATDWDWQDDVSGISIETHDDEEYAVDPNGLEEFLFGEVDREVELTGAIEEDGDGTKCITVTSYEPLSDPDIVEDEVFDFAEDYAFEQDCELEDYDLEFDQEAFPMHVSGR